MQPTTAELLLEKKIELLSTIANTSMLWWVSAVVFCASLLGTIWARKTEVKSLPFRKSLGFLLYFFFTSIVLYGALVTVVTALEFRNVKFFLRELNAPSNLFDADYIWSLVGMPIGTSSFILFLLVWHFLWQSVQRNRT
ncbi:hypothetical protein HJG54_12595 [Leptolyngbya sp. NK1-12]|uniref:Uncharacterized protein n=1 Tax=Leptolyngbya sp. NK1-12 TaxID=2547451 RepID=A0AA96WLP1_9CYAN|nr:hypothetical protein [Leptolyngbya sp. NK1-12]WNZ23606.1 hypothetical protein HJG54_12595 [Leptolyngbya sp. NK1-12]